MTKEELLNELIKIHARFSSMRKRSDKSSQFCTMWSADPPDTLVDTAPIEAITELLQIEIDEDDAVDLFDMDLEEAAEFLYEFWVNR